LGGERQSVSLTSPPLQLTSFRKVILGSACAEITTAASENAKFSKVDVIRNKKPYTLSDSALLN